MALDQFGKIAVAEVAFYAPVLCIAFFIALKHGFGRRQGWVFMLSFSIVRIAGGAITIASKSQSHPPIGLVIAASILSGIGLAPLLMATYAFVRRMIQGGILASNIVLRVISLCLLAGAILAAVGGPDTAPGKSASTVSLGRTLIRIGIILYLAAYILLFGMHLLLWVDKHELPPHHRTLLTGVSLTLPFLLVRIIYAILSAFASSLQSRWSPIFGDWWIYLIMGLIMEYIVVCTYVATGIMIPLKKDDEAAVAARDRVLVPQSSPGYEVEMGKYIK